MILVYIVGPVRVYREGLARALDDAHGELRVLGTSAGAEEAIGQIEDLGPDVVLIDASAAAGISAARTLADTTSATRLIALAAQEDDRTVIDCAEAGIAGFVACDASVDDVVAATQAVMRGETACTPRVSAMLLRRVADGARARPHGELAPLTSRERQIVALIDEGLSNKEIAARLCIELSTVKNHVHHLLEKLGARGRAEAAARVRVAPRPRPPGQADVAGDPERD